MRSRIGIALQALGVAALAAIVYFAFLSPNDSGPLTGIDVGPPAEQAPRERTAKRHKPSPKPKRPRRTLARPAASVPPTGIPPQETVVGLAPDTPAGSQYTSTVARILSQVGGAAR